MSQADPTSLHPIGKVAALNIAQALELGESAAPKIERAIADEINAMSSHFTLAIADVQTQYEAEVAKVKSAHSYVSANVLKVLGVIVGTFVVGLVTGLLI